MKEKFIIIGSNTLFSIRASEILKRNYEIVSLEAELFYSESGQIQSKILSRTQLRNHFSYHDINYVLLSSEYIALISNSNEQERFLNDIVDISEEFRKVKFILVSFKRAHQSFKEDLIVASEKMSSIRNNFIDRFKRAGWSIFTYNDYITHVSSSFQDNPVDIIKESDRVLKVVHVDDIVEQIVQCVERTGVFKLNEIEFSIGEYLSYRSRLKNGIEHDFSNSNRIEFKIAHQKECSVELLYRRSPGEVVQNRVIADIRFQMGASLFNQVPSDVINKLDIIVPVPETGKFYAQGFASASKVPYIEALYKKTEQGRSFDIADTESRRIFLNKKLGVYPELVANKVVGVIDEAIFTGSTLKLVAHLLNTAKAREVYLFIPSPICRTQCSFNMQPQRSMLLSYVSVEHLASYLNVNGVFFQEYRNFENTMRGSGFSCVKCFK